MNSIIYDPRLRRRDEWNGGRGCCRVVYVGMGVGGVEGGGECGGSGSIGVRGWKDGWRDEYDGVHGNQLLLG